MSHRPFRFVHASDFHLERPLHGLAEVPEHLLEICLEAPYLSAQRVFETALAEKVDFVLLAGDILHPHLAGPRGVAFLVEQFERLQAGGIAVYWASGNADRLGRWPAAVRLPGNVHPFWSREVAPVVHADDSQPLALLIGRGRLDGKNLRPTDFRQPSDGLFSIALAHGAIERNGHLEKGIDYWALGGRHQRHRWLQPSCQVPSWQVVYPGSPQGRCPLEGGAHGCALVEATSDGQPRVRMVATDCVRFRHELLRPGDNASPQELRQMLRQRVESLTAAAPGLDHLLRWTIQGPVPFHDSTSRGRLAAELLQSLREEFGRPTGRVWSLSLEIDSADSVRPEQLQPETLVGDYLRGVEALAMDALDGSTSEPSGSCYAALGVSRDEGLERVALLARFNEPSVRRRILAEAASLGAELLAPEERQR